MAATLWPRRRFFASSQEVGVRHETGRLPSEGALQAAGAMEWDNSSFNADKGSR